VSDDSELFYRTVVEMATGIAEGALSSVDLVSAHLERIERHNATLNAIVTLLPDEALDAARNADRIRGQGAALGPLHGLPVAIKDLVDTAGIRTTYGSPIFQDHVPTSDAVIVERLKAAGAIIVGKTNTPEFGAGGAQTYNPVFGATRNPYDTGRTPGGSSGGAGAALAAGMVPFADGTDMGGSVRHPASFCNVVGLRPTPGRIPEFPATDAWDPLSVSGVMGRTVADVAYVLDALCGPHERCALSLPAPSSAFSSGLVADLRGLRVAWSRDLNGLPIGPEVTAVLEPQRRVFEDCGCVVEDDEPDLKGVDEVFDVLRALGFVRAHYDKLRTHSDQLKDTIVGNINAGLALAPERIARAQRDRTAIFYRTLAFFDRYDVLALPVAPVTPFELGVDWVREIAGVQFDNYMEWQRTCSRITVTAHPAISVPGGFSDAGLPVGLQLVARYGNEHRLLQVAHAFEQATGFGRRRPTL
jgi:amidase